MQRRAACLASWFSVDGPLSPDCSAPLNQVTKLNTADSPLANRTKNELAGTFLITYLMTRSKSNSCLSVTDLKVFPLAEEKSSRLALKSPPPEEQSVPSLTSRGKQYPQNSPAQRGHVHVGCRYNLITDKMENSLWNTDLNHGFGQKLRSEQLQHGVHYVLPALPEDVAMPMGKVKHCLGCCLCLAVTSKHSRKVFHRL